MPNRVVKTMGKPLSLNQTIVACALIVAPTVAAIVSDAVSSGTLQTIYVGILVYALGAVNGFRNGVNTNGGK